MKSKRIIISFLIILQLTTSIKFETTKKPLGSRFVKNKEELFFKTNIKFSNESIQTDPDALLRAAKCSLRYFISSNKKDTDLVKSKILEKRIFPHYHYLPAQPAAFYTCRKSTSKIQLYDFNLAFSTIRERDKKFLH